MKKSINDNNKFRVSKWIIIFTLFLFALLCYQISYLCLVDYKVGTSTISAFIKNRNTNEEVIMPVRGTIYDANGNSLASDVVSYTILAYLSDTRIDAKGNKSYVEDIETTSLKLSEVLGVKQDAIKSILENGKNNNKYQVEFGSIGKGISELTKTEIDKLNLQGIDFTKDVKRYYPNGDFASYMIGYTVFKEDEDKNKWIKGEMGIEEYYDSDLKGESGYITYERDKYGYRINNGREYVKPAKNGNDVYLTIDSNIELFVNNAVKKASEESEAEWVVMTVMDAKTGAILGSSSTPSYDPNLRNMTSYIDPLTGLSYEPGSTMKIFSYMCAIDSGNYDGNTKYLSGSKTYTSNNNETTINDWKKEGWGTITYDQGFALSSNIAVANIVESVITKEDLKNCYAKYGFGNKTGFTLNREEAGSIDYKYQIEAATAGYGQGITTTPVQHLQTLSAISNDGIMIKPYVVDKVIDKDTGKIIYEGKREEVGKVANSSTINKMKELMASVINGDNTNSTGYAYHMDGYDLIGKTGTAQIFDYKKGKYMTGVSDYIYSFSGMFPGEDPEIIIYAALKIPKDATNYIAPMVTEVERNITKYLNISDSTKEKASVDIVSYYNKNIKGVKTELSSKKLRVLSLGDDGKVLAQYPSRGSKVYEDDLVILRSSSYDKKMPNLVGYSYKEAMNILKLMGVKYKLEGNGYVTSQNISEGTVIEEEVVLTLKEKYENG